MEHEASEPGATQFVSDDRLPFGPYFFRELFDNLQKAVHNMLRIEWSNEYRVDDGVIDEEHRSLVDMANRVFGMVDPTTNKEEVIDVVKALFRYMEYHFRHEEEFMLKSNYPALLEHAQCHKRITDEMTRSLRGTHNIQQYASQLRHMMVDWVLTHMINEDRKIGAHLKNAEVSAASPVAAGTA